MLEVPPPPTVCEATQNFAKVIMQDVEQANLTKIKSTYVLYSADPDKEILKKALRNYTSETPLTPSEFSIEIFNECMED